jgi:hypothetical protein
MESFSFLKYLRGGVVAGAARAPVAATTIAASAACEDGGGGGAGAGAGAGAGGGGDVEDDASFFDLEFAVPGDESAASDAEEERVEFNFAVAGDDVVASGGGEVVAVDAVPAAPGAAETGDGGKEEAGTADDAAPPPPPSAALLRPATKFRVLLLKLRKPKVPAAPAEANGAAPAAPAPAPAPALRQASRFLIKFRVDEAPLVSLFTRDNSSRTSDAGVCADRPAAVVQAAAVAVQAGQQAQDAGSSSAAGITAEERRFAKEVVLRYLSKIKPLYVKVSRRYGERLRFSGGASEGEETDAEPDLPAPSPSPSPSPSPAPSPQAPTASAAAAPAAAQQQQQQQQPVVVACGVRAPRASVPAGLKQVCKRLGKSRSASSAVAAAPSPPSAGTTTPQQQAAAAPPQRRDDSLLQVQDGIQSAIAHCKRSFNASSKGTACAAEAEADAGRGAHLAATQQQQPCVHDGP